MEPIFNLHQMKNIDIRTVDPAILVELSDVTVDEKLPKRERMLDFIRQIINPYCFKCGEVVVKVGYSSTDATLDDRMESYLRTL